MPGIIELCVIPYTHPYDRYEALFATIANAPDDIASHRDKIVRDSVWWPIARALCRLLYSQPPSNDAATIHARDLLVQAMQTVWYIIYTDVYDIAPPCAWAPLNAPDSSKLHIPVEFAPLKTHLRFFERLTLFRTYIQNGVYPPTAASIVLHLYCLQPRNICTPKHPKADRHLQAMVRDCKGGGKVWVAYYMEPYREWDVRLREYRMTNDRSGV